MGQPADPYYQKAFPVPKRDLAKAKALMQEAGVTGRVPIDFMVPAARDTGGRRSGAVDGAEAGFDLKLRVTEVATALKEAEDGKFQLYQNTWSGRIDPDGNSIIYQACGGPQNMGNYCDKEVDALHEQARATSDLAARKAIYEKLTREFLANGWIIYLYHPQYLIAPTDRLEGFVPIQDGILRVVGVKLK